MTQDRKPALKPAPVPMPHFDLVQRLARVAVVLSGDHSEIRRQITALSLALAKDGHSSNAGGAAESINGQATALARIVERDKVRARGQVDPTPETLAKLKKNAVQEMHRRGSLEDVHVIAAEQIADMHDAMTNGLGMKASSLTPSIIKGSAKAFRDPVERMTERQVRVFHDVYRPWSASEQEIMVVTSNVVTLDRYALTMAIVIDGASCHDIDMQAGIRNGSAAKALRLSLAAYADRAGLRVHVRGRNRRHVWISANSNEARLHEIEDQEKDQNDHD